MPRVEICRLRNDGPAGRLAGCVILVKEFEDGMPSVWGRRMRPPAFDIMVIEGESIASLKAKKPKLFEYGGHRSRLLIDKASLPAKVQADLDDEAAYGPSKTKPNAKVTLAQLTNAETDQGKDWKPSADVGAGE